MAYRYEVVKKIHEMSIRPDIDISKVMAMITEVRDILKKKRSLYHRLFMHPPSAFDAFTAYLEKLFTLGSSDEYIAILNASDFLDRVGEQIFYYSEEWWICCEVDETMDGYESDDEAQEGIRAILEDFFDCVYGAIESL